MRTALIKQRAALATAVLFACGSTTPAWAMTIPDLPLGVTTSAPPMTMLVMGRDHKLFYEAYNDAADLDGDGTIEYRFKPTLTYVGLFDPNLCYKYNGSYDAKDSTSNAGLFRPAGAASDRKCTNLWSGNFLNYLTTSRIDALRVVLYGGYREVDSGTETVLRRAYIPQDAHSWAKEYESVTRDGYKISDYTPLSAPDAGRRHFFGNLTPTASANCDTISSCSNRPPWLSVVKNSTFRVWQWASTERPVLSDLNLGSGTRENLTVRVAVCTGTYVGGCKKYPNENYKPVGLLHDYGESGAMQFGLLTGSYNKNMSGGVLRKAISSFASEINAKDGTFKAAADAPLVAAINALRIRDYNNTRKDNSYRGGWETQKPMTETQFVDWGNPIGEMMYEALRYYAGKAKATPEFATSGSYDADIGLPVATWDTPYGRDKAPWCAKPNMMVISDINPSFDSDQLPGSAFGSFSGDVTGLDVTTLLNTISSTEGISGTFFIGQSTAGAGNNYDGAPTAKAVTSLSTVRGLAPEEPTKQGAYYSAAIAYFGKTVGVPSGTDKDGVSRTQTIDHYFVALASPLPKVAISVNGKSVTLVPFAKSVGGSSIDATKGKFQPTNQIVDFYIESIANTNTGNADATINGGRPYISFQINYEDVEQGADHDMDVIARYVIQAKADGTVEVQVSPTYQAGGIRQHMGYVISGTNRDGVYLVAQDEGTITNYYLNVPPGKSAGYCDASPSPAECNALLPRIGETSTQVFTPSGNSAARLLNDPMWFAAKWGGFVDHNKDAKPTLDIEFDEDKNGSPDTYFLVQNPLKLKSQLQRAFSNIIERNASSSNITSNSTSISNDTLLFQSVYNAAGWSGNVFAYKVDTNGIAKTPSWDAVSKLPQADTRKIYTVSEGNKIEFEWARLGLSDQTYFGSQAVVSYLRGDQTSERSKGGTLRNRERLLGDVVHSSPFYNKDNDTLFVGANDGMLHALSAKDGRELFAFIPRSILPKLRPLADPEYSHRFFVDGDIAVSRMSETTGKNILVGTTGRGHKGIFALDVSNPNAFEPTRDILWDYDGSGDDDMGLVLGSPVITKIAGGKWVALLGNGYNSTSGEATLYVFDLNTGSIIRKFKTGSAGDNGLATPVAFDYDKNGVTDFVYAGDLRGNVWRFNLDESDAPADWAITKLFQAKDADGTPQSITAQPLVVTKWTEGENFGKRFVYFGTGRYIESADQSSKAVQTWYGLIDEGTLISSRTDLTERSFVANAVVNGKKVRAIESATAGDMTGKMGWYIDLVDGNGVSGERIVTRTQVFNWAAPVAIVSSVIPVVDVCVPGGDGYANLVDPFSGAAVDVTLLDVSGDKKFDINDDIPSPAPEKPALKVSSLSFGIGMISVTQSTGSILSTGGSTGELGSVGVNLGIPPKTGRISWREIVQ